MKTRIFLFIGLLFLICSNSSSQGVVNKNNLAPGGNLNVLCSPYLYDLTRMWGDEYGRLNPKVNIKVTSITDDGIASSLKAGPGIGFISNESDRIHLIESGWNIVVGRDVIVPVINAKNPFLDEINQKGIAPETFAGFFKSPGNQTWGVLLGNGQRVPVHFYLINDAFVKARVTDFMKIEPGLLNTMPVESGPEMAAAIREDLYSIGFCRMSQVLDATNQNLAENIRLLPIDKNGNGKIDYMEKIYGNLQSFSRGVWIGKYPKELSRNIYAVATVQPNDKNEEEFLTWVLTDGQKILNQQGFCDLVGSEQQMQLDKLNVVPNTAVAKSFSRYNLLKWALLILLGFFVIGIMVNKFIRFVRNKIPVVREAVTTFLPVFDEDSVIVPKGLYYDKTHTWAFMEKDGAVKVGIDDFLQHITGTITRIEMKETGKIIRKGDKLLTIIRNGKQLHLYAPVSGIITDQNNTLFMDSSTLNTSPYTDGWVYRIDPANWLSEIRFLIMAEQYQPWLKEEFTRLKDFFANAVQAHTPEYAHVVLQDGGVLHDDILADLDPKVWEDFQTNFIDTAR